MPVCGSADMHFSGPGSPPPVKGGMKRNITLTFGVLAACGLIAAIAASKRRAGVLDAPKAAVAAVEAPTTARETAYESRNYAALEDEDFREEVFSLIDEIRWATDPHPSLARLKDMGPRAIPCIEEELKLATDEPHRAAARQALHVLQ